MSYKPVAAQPPLVDELTHLRTRVKTLEDLLAQSLKHHEYCSWGDAWERSCVGDLPARMEAALAPPSPGPLPETRKKESPRMSESVPMPSPQPHPLRCPLVGMHFHPPAKVLVEALPSGTPLVLIREPMNQYDTLAIQVLLEITETIPPATDALLDALAGFGFTLEELAMASPVVLGHIGASGSKASLRTGLPHGNAEVYGLAPADAQWPLRGTLGFSPEGFPMVLVDAPEEE